MAVSRKAMTEGIRTPIILCALIDAALQSLSQKSKIFASSLYTREPWVLPHQCVPQKCSFSSRFDNLLVKNQRFLPAVHCGMTATGSHGNFDSLRGAPPFTQGSLWVLPHQCVYRWFSEEPENCTTFHYPPQKRRDILTGAGSYRIAPCGAGLSHGLKTVHRTVFAAAKLPPPFRVPQRYH